VISRAPDLARPVKILYLLPTLAAGGTEQQVALLIRGLNRTKFMPLVATIYGPDRVPIEVEVRDCRHASLRKPLGKAGNLVALARLWQLIRSERPALIQSFLRPADLYSRLAGPLAGQPKVVTSLRTRIAGFWSPGWQWAERVLWRASAVIVSNSHSAADEACRRLGIPGSRLRVIPNGVDLERFRPQWDSAAARGRIGLVRWDSLVGMVARYSPVKDHETLLLALRRMTQAGDWPGGAGMLLVGGTTYQESRDQVEAQIRDWGLQNRCEVRGVSADIAGVYHALDWMVLPSRYEGFPNTVLEAMACGRPVIVSSAANAEGIVEEDRTGFVFPAGDPDALANCLRKALRLPEGERQSMGRAARAQVERNFSANVMVDRYEALYDELLRKG